MQSIYTHIPETIYVPREYSVAAILLLLFMVLIPLVSVLNLLYFYISTFRSLLLLLLLLLIIILIPADWTFRGSNPGGGETFYNRPDLLWGPPSLLSEGYHVFHGGKSAGTLTTYPHLAPSFRKV